jgi:hypothetical protein
MLGARWGEGRGVAGKGGGMMVREGLSHGFRPDTSAAAGGTNAPPPILPEA